MKPLSNGPVGQTASGLAPCLIYVDKEGNWFHKGAPLIHDGLIRLFYQSLDVDDQNRYTIRLGEQTCLLEVEDTPFVVLETIFSPGMGREGQDLFMLRMIDGTQEALAPDTLAVGEGNVLYCTVKGGRFPARFSRRAYYQLAEHIREDAETGGYVLTVSGTRYPVLTSDGEEIKG